MPKRRWGQARSLDMQQPQRRALLTQSPWMLRCRPKGRGNAVLIQTPLWQHVSRRLTPSSPRRPGRRDRVLPVGRTGACCVWLLFVAYVLAHALDCLSHRVGLTFPSGLRRRCADHPPFQASCQLPIAPVRSAGFPGLGGGDGYAFGARHGVWSPQHAATEDLGASLWLFHCWETLV